MRAKMSVRMFTFFVIVIVFSSTIVGLVLYQQSSSEVDQQTKALLTQIVSNAMNHTDMYLRKYDRATLSIMSSSSVKDFLNMDNSDFVSYFLSIRPMREKIFRPLFINNPEISVAYLINFNGLSIIDKDANDVSGFDQAVLQDHLEQLRKESNPDGKMTIMKWSFINGNLSLTRKLADRQTSKAFKGIFGIEINIEELRTLWEGIKLGDTGYFYIVNDDGEIVYHPNAVQIGKKMGSGLMSSLKKNSNRIFNYTEDQKQVYFNQRSEYSGWTLIATIPYDELRKPVMSIRKTTILTCLLAIIAAVFMAIRFGQSMIRPIKRLESGMRRTEKGDWAHVMPTGREDEMDALIGSYNLMVDRLQELMDMVYTEELKNKEYMLKRQAAEFEALELQINPHFLYNTLEAIVCYAVVQESQEIKEIVRSLSYMLRYSLRADLEEITLVNELKHVLYFMNIMHYRLGYRFELDVQIPPEFLLRKMVRLTLQPIVENVFKHAFPEGIESHHFIRISASTEGEHFVVAVSDNGAGIPANKLEELQNKLHAKAVTSTITDRREREGGIGLLNVHSRIQIVFGEAFGLSVDNQIHRTGTIITLRMPNDSQRGEIIRF